MNEENIIEVAEAWIAHAKDIAESNGNETHAWAWDEEFDLKYENPELLWKLILEIHSRDKDASSVEVLSAGPMEDLLSMHGAKFIEKVEKQAKQDRSFAFLLGGVWKSDINEEIWKRIQNVWDRNGWDRIQKES